MNTRSFRPAGLHTPGSRIDPVRVFLRQLSVPRFYRGSTWGSLYAESSLSTSAPHTRTLSWLLNRLELLVSI